MNHPWQQPIRPLFVIPHGQSFKCDVLFIKPLHIRGWEVITTSGNVWSDENAMIYTYDPEATS